MNKEERSQLLRPKRIIDVFPLLFFLLIRESFRLNNEKFHSGWDIAVIARAAAKGKNYHDIESAFVHLVKLHKNTENR